MNETIDETENELDETIDENEFDETIDENDLDETPENEVCVDAMSEFFASVNNRLDEIEKKLESIVAPIRTLSQKGTSEANTSEAASPTLLYL